MKMPSRLDAIAARLAAATPGPWAYDRFGYVVKAADTSYAIAQMGTTDEDAEAIAHLPEDLRLLLAVAAAAKQLAAPGRFFPGALVEQDAEAVRAALAPLLAEEERV